MEGEAFPFALNISTVVVNYLLIKLYNNFWNTIDIKHNTRNYRESDFVDANR